MIKTAKQHLENTIKNIVKELNNVWYMKIQTFPNAHKRNPADFIVLSSSNKALFECKECKNNRLVFERLTQTEDLKKFKSTGTDFSAFYVISFWLGRKDKSEYYVIDVDEIDTEIKRTNKKSFNMNDFKENFNVLSYTELVKTISKLMN